MSVYDKLSMCVLPVTQTQRDRIVNTHDRAKPKRRCNPVAQS